MNNTRYTGLDFETSIGDNGECILEYVALSSQDKEEVYNLKIEEELNRFIAEIATSGNTYIVFNASFDIEIIMTLFLNMGYEFTQKEERKGGKMFLLAGTKIYKLEIFTRVDNSLIKSTFIDLGNIIVGSNLKEIAENYTDLHKGSYEVSKENEKDFEEYNLLDARITRIAYENITKELGLKCITIGSAAYATMLELAYPNHKRSTQNEMFKENYGDLTLDDDKVLRRFYRGGLGWSSKAERWEGKINSWDKKSAYPCECIGKQLPTYNGHKTYAGYREPNEEYPFAFITMLITGEVKKNHCPVLPSRNHFGDSNNYIYDFKEVCIIKIYGEKSEYDYFMENVKVDDVEYVSTILMKAAPDNPLEKFMAKYYNIKESSTGVKRDVAKRLINSLTGKLGTNPIKHSISYKLDGGVLKRDLFEEEETDTYETHVVAVITSRVRCEMYRIDSILRDKCKFRLYATDSCKHSTEYEGITHQDGIGGWNEEYHNVDFIYVGLKTYMFDPYNEQGMKNVVCSGITRDFKQQIQPDDFYAGNEVPSLISMRSVNGRIIFEGNKRIATSPEKPRTRKELNNGKKTKKV